ncbi:helix-turn-helix domain-containing protein [Streptomyces iconiensis]|uniref:Helix-turn-helix transcriptional regulator n=1 Tax=Streptomyces iconiensis TaxID=1384038 RepID=A0ABT6ZP46_9ACTN|nr:helix-turn-helix transcriptional regulator [Streptomyces iconiensis]MDJ1130832.1 helix-turn-helix transcriptional regulator [Streptomyces iconiensis]
MTQPKNLDPFTSPKTFYGAELRRHREDAGLSQDQLGERVFCSGAYIGQFESAIRRPQVAFSKQFDDTFHSGEHFQRLCRLVHEAEKHPEYYADAAELEKLAKTICEYSPMLVPGFLQTEAYARALSRATQPLASEEEIERHVKTRMDRARQLLDPTGPKLWAILHEAALRITVGSPEVMREQLLHIAEIARTRGALVQVQPNSAGPHPFMMGTVLLMTFDDAPSVVYSEGAHSGQLIDDPALVERNQESYDLARAAALSPEASQALIASATKDYTTP